MSSARLHRTILISGAALALGPLLLTLAGCGQKGPLYIPQTPAAAQRATLPQTLYGRSHAAPAADAASAPPAPQPPLRPPTPDIPDISDNL